MSQSPDMIRCASTTRRDFVKTTALAGVTLAGSAAIGSAAIAFPAATTPRPGQLPITIAGYKLDRVAALIDGRVQVHGCDTRFEPAAIGDMNSDALGGPMRREVTEIGLSPYMLAFANDSLRNHTLIPVFPLRAFRHKSIFIRPDRGIDGPQDLRGKKIATPGYSSTSLTWIRGILRDEYGVNPRDVQWVVSSKDSAADVAGPVSKQESVLPDGLSFIMGPSGKDESNLLVDGDVDALFHAAEPRAFIEGNPECVRLFPDSRQTERDYFSRTGIFPIMHAVAIRLDVVEEHPWLPRAVFDAYVEAKRLMYESMAKIGWVENALPWYSQEFRETIALMGRNFWTYGLDANRRTLETLFEYSHEQGLASRRLTIEELFHPSTLELRDVSW